MGRITHAGGVKWIKYNCKNPGWLHILGRRHIHPFLDTFTFVWISFICGKTECTICVQLLETEMSTYLVYNEFSKALDCWCILLGLFTQVFPSSLSDIWEILLHKYRVFDWSLDWEVCPSSRGGFISGDHTPGYRLPLMWSGSNPRQRVWLDQRAKAQHSSTCLWTVQTTGLTSPDARVSSQNTQWGIFLFLFQGRTIRNKASGT